jgi:hypothetical protein
MLLMMILLQSAPDNILQVVDELMILTINMMLMIITHSDELNLKNFPTEIIRYKDLLDYL